MDYLPIHIRNRKCLKLVVPHGVQQKLARRFCVSRQFVCMALMQRRRGAMAKNIVHVAEEEYGGYWEKNLRS